MSRGVITVLLTIGICSQLLGLWVRQTSFQLTPLQTIGLWTRKLSMLLALLFAGLSFATTRFQIPLDIVFVATLCAWAVSTFWFPRVPTTTPRKDISESTWSPFQSAEVRNICAHLSPTEKARLMEGARERGRLIGQWFAVPLAIVGVLLLLFWSWRSALALGALFVVYFVVLVLPRFQAMRRQSIELLCETEWARSQNYTPNRVRLMTFPWSK